MGGILSACPASLGLCDSMRLPNGGVCELHPQSLHQYQAHTLGNSAMYSCYLAFRSESDSLIG